MSDKLEKNDEDIRIQSKSARSASEMDFSNDSPEKVLPKRSKQESPGTSAVLINSDENPPTFPLWVAGWFFLNQCFKSVKSLLDYYGILCWFWYKLVRKKKC